jgi:hypothetical protein
MRARLPLAAYTVPNYQCHYVPRHKYERGEYQWSLARCIGQFSNMKCMAASAAAARCAKCYRVAGDDSAVTTPTDKFFRLAGTWPVHSTCCCWREKQPRVAVAVILCCQLSILPRLVIFSTTGAKMAINAQKFYRELTHQLE